MTGMVWSMNMTSYLSPFFNTASTASWPFSAISDRMPKQTEKNGMVGIEDEWMGIGDEKMRMGVDSTLHCRTVQCNIGQCKAFIWNIIYFTSFVQHHSEHFGIRLSVCTQNKIKRWWRILWERQYSLRNTNREGYSQISSCHARQKNNFSIKLYLPSTIKHFFNTCLLILFPLLLRKQWSSSSLLSLLPKAEL